MDKSDIDETRYTNIPLEELQQIASRQREHIIRLIDEVVDLKKRLELVYMLGDY